MTARERFRKGRSDDTCRQGDQADPDHCRNARKQPAHRRHRIDIAIADRRQRRDAPPHGARNRAERLGLRRPFDQIQKARRYQQQHQPADQAHGELMALEPHRMHDLADGPRIAAKLGESQNPHEPDQPQQERLPTDHRKEHRGNGDEIEQCRRGRHVAQPPLQRMRKFLVLDAAPHPRAIFDDEHATDKQLECSQPADDLHGQTLLALDHRQQDGEQDHPDQKPVDQRQPSSALARQRLVNPAT